MARPEKIRLGDLLIQQGLLTEEQLKFALDEQKRSGRKLGRIVVESAFVTEEAISQALARQLQAAYVDLKLFNPRPELISLLPEAQARRFRAVVLDETDGRLRVGFADPTDLQAFDELVRLLRREIDLAVVAESQLLALIDRDLGGFDKFREAFIEAGKTQFGSGWCWLALKDGKLDRKSVV